MGIYVAIGIGDLAILGAIAVKCPVLCDAQVMKPSAASVTVRFFFGRDAHFYLLLWGRSLGFCSCLPDFRHLLWSWVNSQYNISAPIVNK